MAPSERLSAADALSQPFVADGFVRGDASRLAYAAASLRAPPYAPPPPLAAPTRSSSGVSSSARRSAGEYRAYVEHELAVALEDPQAPAAGAEVDLTDMGA